MPKNDIIAVLDAYDAWLGQHCAAIPKELTRKRKLMAADPFAFLRGTAFRFAAQFGTLLPKLAKAHHVPACGDAHLENFGTWRDIEGRLVWGVNDLDEACALPFTADLVRLATSALLGRKGNTPHGSEIATILLRGYARNLKTPRPFVLDEEHVKLRAFVSPDPQARAGFWSKLDDLKPGKPPEDWVAPLAAAMPQGAGPAHFAAREAGLGSLGRPRFVAVAEWGGGRVVREGKARVPSAWLQAGFPGAVAIDVEALATGPDRAPDPWLRLLPGLVIRRLAPDSRRLEAPNGDSSALLELLEAMGAEIGILHASGGQGEAVLAALKALPEDWLRDAARTMLEAVEADHAALAKALRKDS